MEYLVTMTTQVPEGTSEQAVDDVRARESVRGRELAEQRHMLRLWRPPLGPGEWRSIGLFSAADADDLEKLLASMPLRVWRTDQVTPLAPHPNDPALPATVARPPEFLTYFTLTIPEDTPQPEADDRIGREAQAARDLGRQGRLVRLWRLPPGGGPGALGLWRAQDATELQSILTSLPLYEWMSIQTVPLTEHPNDPGLTRA